jgi:hypothetical protein
MEEYEELREQARRKISLADHMLTMTYPLVRDTKLLMVVLENIFLSLSYAMGSVLHYERTYKRIPQFTDNFESKYHLFKESCVAKYHIHEDYLKLLKEIKEIIVEHRKSPIEFTRKDSFVICSDSYKIKTVGVEQIKRYISKAKDFITLTNFIVGNHEGITR